MKNISLTTMVTCLVLFLVSSSTAQNKLHKPGQEWIDVPSIVFSPTTVHADKYLRGNKQWSFGAINAGKLKPAKGSTYHKNNDAILVVSSYLKIGDIAGEFRKKRSELLAQRSVSKVSKGLLPIFIAYQDGDDLILRHIGQGK